MATFKCEIRPHQRRADGSFNVKLRITHRRASRWLPTTIDATPEDLTARGTRIKSQRILDRCEDLLREVRECVARLSPFALEEMDAGDLAAWLRRELGNGGWRLDFFAWGRECVAGMSAGARGNYLRALNALSRFLGKTELDINALRAADIRAFGEWLDAEPKAHGCGRGGGVAATGKARKRGGVSASYVRSLARLHRLARKRYNDPDAERQRIPRNPFEGYEVPEAAPSEGQHSLGVAGIQQMIDALPTATYTQQQGLALFLLSFCLMGINLADLWEVRPPKDGWLVYRRKKVRDRKKDATLRIRVPDCALPLADALRDATGERWLGLHLQSRDAVRATQKENKRLRSWQKAAGVEDFTFYAARHSWGTIAHGCAGGDTEAVNEAMGHNKREAVMDIYIEKDWQMLNGINARVLALFDWRGVKNAYKRDFPHL